MTNVLLAGFTSHWLRRESSHENRREKTHKRYAVVRSVPSLGADGENKSCSITSGAGNPQNPAEGEVFFVDFSSYRTFQVVSEEKPRRYVRPASSWVR